MKLGRVVVVGAGPSGCYAATRLAQSQLFEAVHVYEKQETVNPTTAIGRNINITLCKRGIDALKILGNMPSAELPAASLKHFSIHTNQGTFQHAYGGEGLLSVKRNDLYQYLKMKAETAGAIFHFGHTLESVSPAKENGSSLTIFYDKNGHTISEPAALVIGADGVHSSTRKFLFEKIVSTKYRSCDSLQVDSQQHPGSCIIQEHPLGYREITIPADVLSRYSHSLPQDTFHIWGSQEFVVLGLPSPDGTMTLGIYMKKDQLLVKSMKDIVKAMQSNFSDLKELLSEIPDLHSSGRVGSLTTVSSAFYSLGNIALIGDSAHAMLPFLGQGLNSGLEDVCILLDALKRSQTPLGLSSDTLLRILEDFSTKRKKDVDIILAESLAEYEKWRTLSSVDLSHGFQYQIQMSSFFEKISSSTVSYSEAWRVTKEESPPVKGIGEYVHKGETLAVYEAVKTVIAIRSPCDGMISDISFGPAGEPVYKVKTIESEKDPGVSRPVFQSSVRVEQDLSPNSTSDSHLVVSSQEDKEVLFDEKLYFEHLKTSYIGKKLTYMKTTGSTMDDAKSGAHNGCASGTAYMSEAMTAGRGRRGRTWKSPPVGNIYVTVVLRVPIAEGLTKIQFAAAVAVLRAAHLEGILDAKVKWPNDVWVKGHKMAGTLVEAEGEASSEEKQTPGEKNLSTFYLGMGVNVNADIRRDADMRTQATSMANEVGDIVSREKVLANILENLESLLSMEFADILKEFKEFHVVKKSAEMVIYPKDGKEYPAIYDDITMDGKLHVQRLDSKEPVIVSDTATSVRPEPKSVIYVYDGEGCANQSVQMLNIWLETMVDTTKYKIKRISSEETKTGKWRESCALFAVGGGYDMGYINALQEDGLLMIKEYVHSGGAYLGICAGAYLGCSDIEFDKGGPLEVCGRRQLEFFQGKCIGPVYQGFQYNSEAGARAACIKLQDDASFGIPLREKMSKTLTAQVYFNGGGTFIPDKKNQESCVVARYEDTQNAEESAAIISCRAGAGVAVLSSVHFEYLAEDLDSSDEYLKTVVPKLRETLHRRDFICSRILQILRL
ncbi:uncharacterized protein LOC106182074 [Lingula anatina]|uniref:Uncharacterized protein LOC106182074 n=1 Tax=Lingula anatina TaxID=7574 RepID=A0A1S3KI35_LINAN|nr:uncharacterized protein LOC106182074 [Lingula anatina]|eukprot:XP_013422157.1 uncharacterized protein LOC106182074 [Lingula anatina]